MRKNKSRSIVDIIVNYIRNIFLSISETQDNGEKAGAAKT